MSEQREAAGDVAWILFDGLCVLCDGWVGWLLSRDRRGGLRFGALQGETAAELRRRHPGLPSSDETLLLVISPLSPAEAVSSRSKAVVGALRRLGGGWRALGTALALVPRPLRDALYRFVARRRARWFGRRDACRVPSSEVRSRFLP